MPIDGGSDAPAPFHWVASLRARHGGARRPRQQLHSTRAVRLANHDPPATGRAWARNLLNLRVADIYDQHGIAFLRALKETLPWQDLDNWTTTSLLPLKDADGRWRVMARHSSFRRSPSSEGKAAAYAELVWRWANAEL